MFMLNLFKCRIAGDCCTRELWGRYNILSVQWVTNNPDPRMILEYIVRCKNNFGNVWNKKIYLYMVKKIAANLHHTEE